MHVLVPCQPVLLHQSRVKGCLNKIGVWPKVKRVKYVVFKDCVPFTQCSVLSGQIYQGTVLSHDH